MGMIHHVSPAEAAILGAIVAMMTAVIGVRAYRRGRIVVGWYLFQHHVHRNRQPGRFWLAFAGNAAVFVLGIYLLVSWLAK